MPFKIFKDGEPYGREKPYSSKDWLEGHLESKIKPKFPDAHLVILETNSKGVPIEPVEVTLPVEPKPVPVEPTPEPEPEPIEEESTEESEFMGVMQDVIDQTRGFAGAMNRLADQFETLKKKNSTQ